MNILAPFALVLLLAACGLTEPYVYRAGEFNRSSDSFNQVPTEISEVAICHNGAVTTGQTLQEMANEHCALVGKVALYRSVRWGDCPVATPAGAVFDCVKPDGR